MPKYIETSEDATRFFAIDPTFSIKESKRNPEYKKIILLDMAKEGKPRPSEKSKDSIIKSFGIRLSRYTNLKSSSYDKEFDEEIKRLRPYWFENSADIKKVKLLEMAKEGKPRPSSTSKDFVIKSFGTCLSTYTNLKNDSYDKEFDEEIRELRSDWFENSADIKKVKLLEMAKEGKSRPSESHKDSIIEKLGRGLSSYTNQKKSGYDKEFDEEIRRLRPDWFARSRGL